MFKTFDPGLYLRIQPPVKYYMRAAICYPDVKEETLVEIFNEVLCESYLRPA